MTNSEVFDFFICRILNDVCEKFPCTVNLSSDEYCTLLSDADDSKKIEMFYNTVRWLETHGYLIIGSKTLGADFYLVSPTEKTMLIMDTIPTALKEKGKSMKQHIKGCVTAGTSDAFKDVVKTTLAMGFSAILP